MLIESKWNEVNRLKLMLMLPSLLQLGIFTYLSITEELISLCSTVGGECIYPDDDATHVIVLKFIMIIITFYNLLVEATQIVYAGWDYLLSLFNYFDWLSQILLITTLVLDWTRVLSNES